MLGKQHVSISIASIVPFVIPMFFSDNSNYPLYFISLMFAVIVGSLTPDADCGGKSKLYYDFKIVYDIMIPLQKTVIWTFKRLNLKNKLNLEYEVNNEHRGIMHAPIGILISSTILTLITIIGAFVLLREVNIIIALFVFVGLLTGQFLHLLEDSCTVAGINWKFPFGKKKLNGKIYTFSKIEGKKDIRPAIYEYSLWAVSIVLFAGYIFEVIRFAYMIIYPIISLAVVFVWAIIIYTSRTDYEFWYQDIETIKKIKKTAKNLGK